MTPEDFLTEENRRLIQETYEAVMKASIDVEIEEDITGFHLSSGVNIYPEVKTFEEQTLNGSESVERLVWTVDTEVVYRGGGSYWELADCDFVVIAEDLPSIYDAIQEAICAEVRSQINNIAELNALDTMLKEFTEDTEALI